MTNAQEFLNSVESLCGEANEAARLSASVFDGSQQERVRRALARCMELMEQEVLPVFHAKYPTVVKKDTAG